MSIMIQMAAASAAAAVAKERGYVAPRKPKAGSRAGAKRAWFAKLRGQLAAPTPVACSRCRFDNGDWLGFVPSIHTCGKGIA